MADFYLDQMIETTFDPDNYTVTPVPNGYAQYYTVRYHYLKRKCQAKYCFGLFRNQVIAGVCVFGRPASRNIQKSIYPDDPDIVIELSRLWVCDDEPKNTESFFVSRCLKMLGPQVVVSYADTKEGHEGIIYRALNFHYAGWTEMDQKSSRKTYQFKGGNAHPRHISVSEMKNRGIEMVAVENKPKARYWIVTGDKREKRELEKKSRWPIMNWKEHPVPFEHKRLELI